MTLQFVTLLLDKYDGSGNLVTQGRAVCRTSAQVTAPGDGSFPCPVSVDFSSAGGSPAVQLLACDTEGTQPAGWYWGIDYYWMPGNPPPDYVSVLAANGPTQYLSTLSPPQSVMPMPSGTPNLGNVPQVSQLNPLQVQWQASDSADKNFTLPFNVASTVTVTHNLGKYPVVSVFDSAGSQVEGDVTYTTLNQLTVSFSAPFSGTVTCD